MTTKPANDSWETIAVDMSVEVKTKESSRSSSVGRTKDCMTRRGEQWLEDGGVKQEIGKQEVDGFDIDHGHHY